MIHPVRPIFRASLRVSGLNLPVILPRCLTYNFSLANNNVSEHVQYVTNPNNFGLGRAADG